MAFIGCGNGFIEWCGGRGTSGSTVSVTGGNDIMQLPISEKTKIVLLEH